MRSYEKDGETKWITEVIVDKFEFVDSNNNTQNETNDNTQSTENPDIDDKDDFPL